MVQAIGGPCSMMIWAAELLSGAEAKTVVPEADCELTAVQVRGAIVGCNVGFLQCPYVVFPPLVCTSPPPLSAYAVA